MAQVPCFLTLFATLRNGAASGCQTVTADCPFVVFLEHPVLPVKRTVRYIGKYPAHFLFRALGDNDPVVDLLGAQSGIFADAGITGVMAKKRDEFNRMIELCREKKIDHILTKSISRFARNIVDSIKYIRELKALGISIY